MDKIVERLQDLGYEKTRNLDLLLNQYYLNEEMRAVSILVDGIDVDISETHGKDYQSLIQLGDVNFNCCVFDVHGGKVLNPEIIDEIDSKILKFPNPNRIIDDPLIAVNALKQISYVPDISIPEETLKTLEQSIPLVVDIIRKHPELRYKIQSFCGNINSEQALEWFRSYGGTELFTEFAMRKGKVKISNPIYESLNLNKITPSDRESLTNLLHKSYKESFDEKKLLPSNVNSVIIEREGNEIVSCCCMDGERMYSAASRNGLKLIRLFRDIVHSNYNIWATADAVNAKIIVILLVAGMNIEINPEVIQKILKSKDPKYSEHPEILHIYSMGQLTIFDKETNADYPQILLRN